jgi:hypothetical protein
MPTERRRSRRAVTAGLGLFALLLQLTLSFGHLHLEGLRASLAGTTVSEGKYQNAAAVADKQKQNPGHSEEDDCPICMTMHMAAAGAQPIPPVLFVPFEYSYILPPTIVEKFLYRVPRHALFQTRAPPIA